MIRDCFKHHQIFKSIQHQQLLFRHVNKSFWICWMLSVLEKLPHLLLLHFTYHSLDSKTSIDSVRNNSDGSAHRGMDPSWHKNAFFNDTLFLTSLNLCLNCIHCTGVKTENQINFLRTLIFQTLAQFTLGCSG